MVDRPRTGRRALVTGASAAVALAARREDRLVDLADEVAADHAADAIAVPTDVTDPDAVERLVTETVDSFGGLDVAVSNAGVSVVDPTEVRTEFVADYRDPQRETVRPRGGHGTGHRRGPDRVRRPPGPRTPRPRST